MIGPLIHTAVKLARPASSVMKRPEALQLLETSSKLAKKWDSAPNRAARKGIEAALKLNRQYMSELFKK